MDADLWSRIAGHFGLSRREAEIVRLLLDNREIDVIAVTCRISTRTVRAHVERVYRKLDLHHRSDLILLVLAEVLRRRRED